MNNRRKTGRQERIENIDSDKDKRAFIGDIIAIGCALRDAACRVPEMPVLEP